MREIVPKGTLTKNKKWGMGWFQPILPERDERTRRRIYQIESPMIIEPTTVMTIARASVAFLPRRGPWQPSLKAESQGLPLGFTLSYAPACNEVKYGSFVSPMTCIAAKVSIGAL